MRLAAILAAGLVAGACLCPAVAAAPAGAPVPCRTREKPLAPPAETPGLRYKLRCGESLAGVYASLGPDGSRWSGEFLARNAHIPDPADGAVGDVIIIPEDVLAPRPAAMFPPCWRIYSAAQGELLAKVYSAAKIHGWREFFALNEFMALDARLASPAGSLVPAGPSGLTVPARQERLALARPPPEAAPAALATPALGSRAMLSLPAVGVAHVLCFLLAALVVLLSLRPAGPRAIVWIIVGVQMVISLRYLTWRWLYTFNYHSTSRLVLSVTLWGAEVYSFITMILFNVQARRSRRPRASPLYARPQDMPTVDLFVTIYNEPVEVLERTLVNCMSIDYPADKLRVHVLDDGNRQVIRDLAARLGVNHIARQEHRHAKAGNINHGLQNTSGEFIAFLDTDHVPTRGFIKQMVGFFRDSKVDFIQAPHYFYNPDPFQLNLKYERVLVPEQDLFFRVISPCKDNFNTAFFVGSAGMMRRKALEAIGGFRVESVIEDMCTSLALHGQGCRSVYIPHVIAAGLSPETFGGYIRQRQRWVTGAVQVFVRDNPLWYPGLTLQQRMHYFASLLWFFHGLPRLIFLTSPLFYLLINYQPLLTDVWVLTAYFLPHYVAQQAAFSITSREARNPFWSDVYETAAAFPLTRVVLASLLMPGEAHFDVTPKGAGQRGQQTLRERKVFPHLILMGLIILGILRGLLHIFTIGARWDATVLSFVWAVYNLLLLAVAIRVTRDSPDVHANHRIARERRSVVSFNGSALEGRSIELSETGMSLSLERRTYVPKDVKLRLYDSGGRPLDLSGQVLRCEWPPDNRTVLGVRFTDLDEARRHALQRFLYGDYDSWDHEYRPRVTTPSSIKYLVIAAIWGSKHGLEKKPAWPQVPVRLPCAVIGRGEGITVRGRLLVMDPLGMNVVLNGAVPLSQELTFLFPPQDQLPVHLQGRMVTGRIVRPIGENGHAHAYRIRFTKPDFVDMSGVVA